ncbi:MAG: hypothetical protein ISN64_01865 [Rickettsia sp.]|nr:hypothetical protein [Rickettsia sp.]
MDPELSILDLNFLLYGPIKNFQNKILDFFTYLGINSLDREDIALFKKKRNILITKIFENNMNSNDVLANIKFLLEGNIQNLFVEEVQKINADVLVESLKNNQFDQFMPEVLEKIHNISDNFKIKAENNETASIYSLMYEKIPSLMKKTFISEMKKESVISNIVINRIFNFSTKNTKILNNLVKNTDFDSKGFDKLDNAIDIYLKNPEVIKKTLFSVVNQNFSSSNILENFTSLKIQEQSVLTDFFIEILTQKNLNEQKFTKILKNFVSNRDFVDASCKFLLNFVKLAVNSDNDKNVENFIKNIYKDYIDPEKAKNFDWTQDIINILSNSNSKNENTRLFVNNLSKLFTQNNKISHTESETLLQSLETFKMFSNLKQKEIIKKQEIFMLKPDYIPNTIQQKYYKTIFKNNNKSDFFKKLISIIIKLCKTLLVSYMKHVKLNKLNTLTSTTSRVPTVSNKNNPNLHSS